MADRHGERPPARKRDRSQKPTPHDRKRLERALARVGLGVPDAAPAEPGETPMSTGGSDGESIADASDRLERMWRDIILQRSKGESDTIRSPADDAM